MASKGWQRVGYAPTSVVTLNDPEDAVEAQFEPNSADGWNIYCQGTSNVGFKSSMLTL